MVAKEVMEVVVEMEGLEQWVFVVQMPHVIHQAQTEVQGAMVETEVMEVMEDMVAMGPILW
jgi:hypothetical protein